MRKHTHTWRCTHRRKGRNGNYYISLIAFFMFVASILMSILPRILVTWCVLGYVWFGSVFIHHTFPISLYHTLSKTQEFPISHLNEFKLEFKSHRLKNTSGDVYFSCISVAWLCFGKPLHFCYKWVFLNFGADHKWERSPFLTSVFFPVSSTHVVSSLLAKKQRITITTDWTCFKSYV